jgi:cold shock CspA family protein
VTMQGRVTAFDAARGIGTIDDGGGVPHRFHAATIADGSRRIEVGTDVSFERLARFGAWEATAIRPRS